LSALKHLAFDTLSILTMLGLWAILMIVLPVGTWSDVVLYNGVGNACLALAALAFVVFAGRKQRSLDTKLLVISTGGLAVLLVLVLGPVAIDRSLSLYLLNQIDRHDGAVTQGEVDKMIGETYPIDMKVRDQRVVEQINTGNLQRLPDGRLTLTERGRAVMRFTKFIRRAFGLNPLPE
jgi:hypothetical protein